MSTPDPGTVATGPSAADGGLSTAEAARRLAAAGANALKREASRPAWRRLVAQYLSPLISLLAAASVVSAALGGVVDAIAIAAILLINGLVGFFQEYRAERAVLALRSLTAPRARVLRDGRASVIPAAQVVPGDILLLEAGDVIAADARLREVNALQTGEAALTGESTPVEKALTRTEPGAALAERHDCVFMGTSVTYGTGVAEVFATGASTELGKIAHLLSTAEDTATPLQRRLARVSHILIYLCLGVVALVALAGLLRGQPGLEVLITAVSLAVAAVPEGLPAIVTIALAVGVQRMVAQRVLVRRLHAVETLGCATVVCTDKTGTLTTGVMTVRELWGGDEHALLFAAAACCDAELGNDGSTGVGDPTEIALLAAAYARGISRNDIEQQYPRTRIIPFDSVRKRMAIGRADGVLYVKGAVEMLLALSRTAATGANEAAVAMASRGLRVLAIATGSGVTEENLTLLGLVGMADPPRQEAIAAVAAARRAGVSTVMITGDHPVTAGAIAVELGIVMAGESPDGLVHARATPEDKLRIVRDWKARGAVVAMTGDGVNDAPALREAHIGIAMGITGTEVTREASDMILTDDNFASIISALREGRGIFDNIRKTIVYLLAGNVAELAVMLIAALAGLPLPLLPLHILWINLATDGLPALALVTDPTDDDVMQRAPRRPDEPMLGHPEWFSILAIGLLEAAVVLAVFLWALETRGLEEARNLAFTTLVFSELFRAFGARSAKRMLWEIGLFTNKRLLAVIVISALLQIGIHHVGALQQLLHIGPLSLLDCVMTLLIGLVPLVCIEMWKLRRQETCPAPPRRVEKTHG